MIACVLAFSGYFFVANKRQRAGKTVIEGTVRKVFDDQPNIEADMMNRLVSDIHIKDRRGEIGY